MNVWALIPLVTCFVYVGLLILALQQIKKRANKIFAFFLGVAAFWSFTSFMLHLEAPESQTLFWNQILVVALVWTVIAYYHFTRAYTNRTAGRGLYIGYALLLLLAGLSLSGNIVQSARVSNGVFSNDLGGSEYLIGVFGLAYTGAVIYLLVRKYRRSIDTIDRNRTMYLVAGWSILVVLSYTNLIPAVAGLPLDHMG
ncbi:MAG: histidine kinase N-terminal 7TM domain-containing protein, partial [Dehalococcoidales bacterium]